ncbi:YbaK/EbsC family protein [Gottschalkiaceae bacterium SANA]|nr:YbaK/EbsC family protein [Gottschalkiaceae bacterium SANA]
MSKETVLQQFFEQDLDLKITEFGESTATVELAAQAIGVEPAQIAKTMGFRLKDQSIVIVSKGDARIDNKKFKSTFATKAKMIPFAEVESITGHPAGGVCPFGLKDGVGIYLDESLKEFDLVYPAGGTPNTAVKITVDQLAHVTKGTWIDVCKNSEGK